MLLVEDTARCGLHVPFTRSLKPKANVVPPRRQYSRPYPGHITRPSIAPQASLASEIAATSTSAEGLDSPAKAAGDAFQDLSNSAGSADPGSAIGEASRQASEATSSATQAADLTSASPGGPGILEGLQNAFNGVNKSVTDAASNLKNSLTGSIAGGQDSISGGSEEVQRQVQGFTTELTNQFEDATGEVGKGFTKTLTGLSDAASGAFQDASSGLTSLRGAASGAAEDFGSQALQSANDALYSLPEPVRESIQAAVSPIIQALEIPTIRNSAIALSVGYTAYSWFTARFGGFAGRLSAAEALNLLDTEDAVLLDVRPDLVREASGIPELRFGARNKGVALPLVRVRQKAGTQVVRADVLSFQVAAILVQGLGKVSRKSKIIVLGDSDTQSVKLARAIAADINLKAYILKGGFQGWTAAGLPVKDDIEYESNAMAGFNDTVEGSIIPFVTNPLTVIGAVILGLGIPAVIIDEHKTLQFIGAFGLLFTLVTIPVRYNSLEEARDGILGPYLRAINFVLGLFPKSKLQASPGTAPSASTGAALSASSANGQKALPGRQEADDGYGGILSEDTGTQPVGRKPDLPTTSSDDTKLAKPDNGSPPETAPAESSAKRSLP